MSSEHEVSKASGQLFHTDIRSSSPAATAAFVAAVLGWTVHDTPHPSYEIIETPSGFEGHIGPIFVRRTPAAHDHFSVPWRLFKN